MNNGFASDIFHVKRGVRQEDPLSPYLFIIALEVANISIRGNSDIGGIKVGKHEIRLTVFADDLTTFVSNTKSFFSLKGLLDRFGEISGLKLNEEKTVYWLGSFHDSPEDIGIDKVNKPIKILGIYFTYNRQKFQELNFENIGRDPFNQNSNRSDREKRTTSKGGPVFSKLFRLDRTDPLSFGPKFPEILVEWIAPIIKSIQKSINAWR